MKRWMPAALAALALLFGPIFGPAPAVAQDVVIGTGSPNGIYFHVGRSICRVIERSAAGLTCEPLATEGSLFNLSNLQSGAIEIGVAQSDWHFNAYKKAGPYEFIDQDFSNLRSLFSLHSEAFTVVARADAGITTFDDLRGKRVNLGNPGSGHRATMDVIMGAKGWTPADFAVAQELNASEHVLALCHDRVQALTFMVGHPNPSIGKAIGLCGARLIDISDSAIDKLVLETPYYTPVVIPENSYPGSPEAVKTFGVRATVVSTSEVDADTIYQVVKAVFDDLDTFKDYHPSFRSLNEKRMVTSGLTAPLHEGALRYYEEVGLK